MLRFKKMLRLDEKTWQNRVESKRYDLGSRDASGERRDGLWSPDSLLSPWWASMWRKNLVPPKSLPSVVRLVRKVLVFPLMFD